MLMLKEIQLSKNHKNFLNNQTIYYKYLYLESRLRFSRGEEIIPFRD
jgi:hypothetical protein